MEENTTGESKGLGAVHLPWTARPPAGLITSPGPLFPGLACRCLLLPGAPYQLCPSQRMPLPSLPLPSLPSLPLRKTEQVTLFPWLHTHAQYFPLQDFWPPLIVSTLGKEGESSRDASSCILAHVSGNCPWTPLASVVSTSTHNPSRAPVPSQPEAEEPCRGEGPGGAKACGNSGRVSCTTSSHLCRPPGSSSVSEGRADTGQRRAGDGRESHFPSSRLTRTGRIDEVTSTHTIPISELGKWRLFCEIIPVRENGCLPKKT